MSGPWEKYKVIKSEDGPWTKYADGPRPGHGPKPVNMGKESLMLAPAVLDYGGNMVRGAGALAAQELTDKDLGVKPIDLVTPGAVPNTAELMKRGGVPEGGKLSDVPAFARLYAEKGTGSFGIPEKGGALDPSVRGAAGFIGDIATDPSSYLNLVLGRLGKAGGMVGKVGSALEVANNPVSKTLETGGEKLYKSALKKVDERAIQRGGEAVSPYMFQEGQWGTNKSLQAQNAQSLKSLGNKRSALYKQAGMEGGYVDPLKVQEEALANLDKRAEVLQDPSQLEKYRDYIKARGVQPMPIQQASDIKSNLYESLPQSFFDPLGRPDANAALVNADLAKGYRKQILDAAGERAPQIDAINQEMGARLGAQKPLRSEVIKDTNKNLFSQVDGMLFGHGLEFLGKNAMRALNATPVRTGGGLLINRMGQIVPESALKQMAIYPMRPEYSSWDNLK